MPKQVVSDRSSIFTSAFFTKVCELLRVQQCLSTAYHPLTDGQTERCKRTLAEMLRHFVSPTQDDQVTRLPCCKLAVNNPQLLAMASAASATANTTQNAIASQQIPNASGKAQLQRKGAWEEDQES